jgi:hypothetical protein
MIRTLSTFDHFNQSMHGWHYHAEVIIIIKTRIRIIQ